MTIEYLLYSPEKFFEGLTKMWAYLEKNGEPCDWYTLIPVIAAYRIANHTDNELYDDLGFLMEIVKYKFMDGQ